MILFVLLQVGIVFFFYEQEFPAAFSKNIIIYIVFQFIRQKLCKKKVRRYA